MYWHRTLRLTRPVPECKKDVSAINCSKYPIRFLRTLRYTPTLVLPLERLGSSHLDQRHLPICWSGVWLTGLIPTSYDFLFRFSQEEKVSETVLQYQYDSKLLHFCVSRGPPRRNTFTCTSTVTCKGCISHPSLWLCCIYSLCLSRCLDDVRDLQTFWMSLTKSTDRRSCPLSIVVSVESSCHLVFSGSDSSSYNSYCWGRLYYYEIFGCCSVDSRVKSLLQIYYKSPITRFQSTSVCRLRSTLPTGFGNTPSVDL